MTENPETRETEAASRPGPLQGWWRDLRAATGHLTVLKLGAGAEPASAGGPFRAFPVVGIGLGLAAALVFALGIELGFHGLASAVLAVGTLAVLTGARPEVGFAAFLDGLASGADGDTRRAIASAGRLGERGFLALLFDVALRVALLAAFATASDAAAALIAAAAASRAAPVVAMYRLPPLPGADRSAWPGTPTHEAAWTAGALGVAFALLFLGPGSGALAAIFGVGVVWGAVWLVRRLVGGHSPAALAFVQQCAEIAVLAAALIVD